MVYASPIYGVFTGHRPAWPSGAGPVLSNDAHEKNVITVMIVNKYFFISVPHSDFNILKGAFNILKGAFNAIKGAFNF
jgi:hypothetical protein